MVADGRSLKDVCKELADQNKLGEVAKRDGRAAKTICCFECGDSGESGDMKCCPGCDQTCCSDCAKATQRGGDKLIDHLFRTIYVLLRVVYCVNMI